MEGLTLIIMLVIITVLVAAIVFYGDMQRRMSEGLIGRQNELVGLLDLQHTRQVESDRIFAQALAELSLHVRQSNQISRDQQSIMAVMHADISEWSGDVSRDQHMVNSRLETIDDRLGAILELVNRMYRETDAGNKDMRSMLNTLSAELRAWKVQPPTVAGGESS